MQRSAYIPGIAARHSSRDETSQRQDTKVTIMTNHHASRGLRAALFVFSGALLLGLAACNNGYGPPLPGQASLTWGQQHYLDVQKAHARHDATRSNNGGTNGPGTPH
jgi:hypothetical protein